MTIHSTDLERLNSLQSRRQFFTTGRNVMGTAALASLLGQSNAAGDDLRTSRAT